jgi:translocation and assembly module TamB
MTKAMKPTSHSRARRLWRIGVFLVVFAAAGFVVALPWVLALPFAQRQLKDAANRILAPSRVEFGSIALSWNHSTSIGGLVLHDAQGDQLVVSPHAVFNWSLSQILFAQPTDARLVIEKGDLDIERFADGKVDLYETLEPVIKEHPEKRLVIRIPTGSLRFRDPAFSEPVIAERADMTIDLGMLDEPIRWDIHLTRTDQSRRLDFVGEFSRADIDSNGQHDVELALKAMRWPWTLTSPLIEARGELSGAIDGRQKLGRISLEGDASVTGLAAVGSILGADTLHIEKALARWKAQRDGKAWTVTQLELTSPLGMVRAEGCVPPTPDRGAWLQGDVDLAALARQLPQTLHLRDDLRVERGSARLRADFASNAAGDVHICDVRGKVTELVAHLGEKTLTLPESANLTAKIRQTGATTTLDQFEIQTAFLTADGHGDLDRGIVVQAAIDLAVFRERFRDWIDLGGVVLAGKGKLNASYRRQGETFDAQATSELRDLRLDGLPATGRFKRELVTLNATAQGGALASGWPRDWRTVTLEAKSGDAQGKVVATNDAAAGRLNLGAQGRADLNLKGRHDRFEAELNAIGENGRWTADRIALALTPITPGAAPGKGVAAVRFSGRGTYDLSGDVLTIESAPRSLAPGARAEPDTWIAGDQKVTISGLRSWPAAELEAAAKVDLVSLSPLLADEDEAFSGGLDALVRIRPDRDVWNLGVRLDLHDPGQTTKGSPRFKIDGNVTLTVTANYAPGFDRMDFAEIGMKAPYVQLDGAGSVSKLSDTPELDLKGTLGLDWPAIEKQLALQVEPGARLTGSARPWRLSGTVPSDIAIDRLGSLRGDIGVQIDSLDIFGMRLSQTPIVVRASEGRLKIDPIDAKLNGGVLHADPELARIEDKSSWLKFSSQTRLEGAVINDEVSHRILSFAAPVLDGATRVQGRVSFDLDEAVFPIMVPRDAQYLAQGKVLFDDVRFMPGELADQLLSVFRLESKPLVELRDPVSVRITDGKVYQKGLVVPVGNLASIALDGSVDFDKNLDMVARFALNPPRTHMPVLSPLVETARFELPLRGTLAKPKIDGDAMKEKWKLFGNSLLQGSLEAGVNGLQKLFQGMPEQPFRGLFPRSRTKATTPEERRRLKEERRKDRLEKKSARLKEPAQPE